MQLINGDCLVEMDRLIEQGIKVDAIITDIPYGTTGCKWDSVIPFDSMWDRINKLIKSNSAICLFGSQPFTSMLVSSNIKCFKCEWIYQKTVAGNFATAKYQPMKEHENICVFSKDGEKINYYPIMQPRSKGGSIRVKLPYNKGTIGPDIYNNLIPDCRNYQDPDWRNPSSVQIFNNKDGNHGLHPTQKPVALIEYLVKTYTQENELVLDFTAGSFTTAIACINTNRQFIGIELDEKYYNIGVDRVNQYKGILR